METKIVRAVRRIPAVESVYNVRVAQNRNYFANGVLVHNCDDPNDGSDAYSEADLERVINWWDTIMPTRVNDLKTARRIVVQQRIHQRDLSGHITSHNEGEWTHLCLPLEYEPARKCHTVVLPSTDGKPWCDPREVEGESLCPMRWGTDEIRDLKKMLKSEYAIAGQLQQRPAPAEGGMIKRAWFKLWKKEPPKFEFILTSWDTALSEREEAAYSACVTLGVFKEDNGMPAALILHAGRWRLEYPELRKLVRRLADNYLDDGETLTEEETKFYGGRPDMVLIEHKASGISLIQDLMRAGVPGIMKFDPTKFGDKIGRVRAVTHLLENGRVWVPAKYPDYIYLHPMAAKLVDQLALFPRAEARDLTDALVQAILRLSASGWVTHGDDPREEDDYRKAIRDSEKFDYASPY